MRSNSEATPSTVSARDRAHSDSWFPFIFSHERRTNSEGRLGQHPPARVLSPVSLSPASSVESIESTENHPASELDSPLVKEILQQSERELLPQALTAVLKAQCGSGQSPTVVAQRREHRSSSLRQALIRWTSHDHSEHSVDDTHTEGGEHIDHVVHRAPQRPTHRIHHRVSENSTEAGRRVACPFHKSAPDRYCPNQRYKRQYQTCPRGFDSIRRLKDHLKEVHRGPKFFCEKCGKRFKTKADQQEHEHLREISPVECQLCVEQDHRDMCAVRPRIDKIMDRRKKSKVSTKETWYQMWEQLFPRLSRPESPFQEVSLMEFAFYNAQQAVVKDMVTIYLQKQPVVSEEDATQMFQQAFEKLRNRFFELYDFRKEEVDQTVRSTINSSSDPKNFMEHVFASSPQYDFPLDQQDEVQFAGQVFPGGNMDFTEGMVGPSFSPYAMTYPTSGAQEVGTMDLGYISALDQGQHELYPNNTGSNNVMYQEPIEWPFPMNQNWTAQQ